jgi:hypothetical protein
MPVNGQAADARNLALASGKIRPGCSVGTVQHFRPDRAKATVFSEPERAGGRQERQTMVAALLVIYREAASLAAESRLLSVRSYAGFYDRNRRAKLPR